MAKIIHKDTPPEEYEIVEIGDEYMAGCPYCDFVTVQEPTKEQARVRLAMHILDEQQKELDAP